MTPDPSDGLEAILRPRTIAVVGASRRKGSIGRQVLENLLRSDFQGTVHPVNPNARAVSGVRAYPSVEAVPDPVDMAVIVVPAELVLEVAEDCGRAGVGGLVVISAGFREVGGDGTKREARLAEIAREHGMRVVGPNCMGVLNTDPAVRMNATFSPSRVPTGGLAFVSQSGALGLAILDIAEELGLGLSHFVSLGNRMDVSSNDLLSAWGEDDDVEAMLLYLEHFGNPRNFIDVAREVTPHKPVVAVKSGRSKAGARAARSHTGAMAEEDVLTEALFEQCGVLRADTIEEMFAYARVFARAPQPAGGRVAILTNSGGPGIMAVDAMDHVGLELADLTEATRQRLQEITVAEASIANPVDLTAGGGPEVYQQALEALLEDETVDSVLVIYTPPTYIEDAAVVDALLAPDPGDKPLLCCVLGRGEGDTAFHRLTEAGLPTFTFPETAVRALSAYVAWGRRRARPLGQVPTFEDVDRDRARAVLDQAVKQGREWLGPVEVFDLLEAYGIPVPDRWLVKSASAAGQAAQRLEGACVLKAQAEGLVHKSDVGGVVTGIQSSQEAEDAYEAMAQRVSDAGYELEAVLVQRQIPQGREVIMGMSADPAFGPTILFGLGGIHVEVMKDVVLRLAPLTDEEAARMVRAIRAWPILEGVRGEPRADVEALEEILLRLSILVWDQPALQEMDLNPVIVADQGEGAWAVDARVRLWPGGQPPRAPGVVPELREDA